MFELPSGFFEGFVEIYQHENIFAEPVLWQEKSAEPPLFHAPPWAAQVQQFIDFSLEEFWLNQPVAGPWLGHAATESDSPIKNQIL